MKKSFLLTVLCTALALILALPGRAVNPRQNAYETYNYSFEDNSELASAAAYVPTRVIRAQDMGLDSLRTLSDLFIDEDSGFVFLADSDNNRIIRTNLAFDSASVIDSGAGLPFAQPRGLFASDGCLYVADTGNRRVVKMSYDGEALAVWGKPDSPQFASGVDFKPQKLAVSAQGEISIVCEGVYEGLVVLDQKGSFQGYSGTIPVKPSLWQLFWRTLSTREQLAAMTSFLPITYTNVDMDSAGFMLAVSQADQSSMANSVQRLNPGGNDVLVNTSGQNMVGDLGNLYDGRATGPSVFNDVAALEDGLFVCLDSRRSKIFMYDSTGDMLFAFGGLGSQTGNITVPSAIDNCGFTLYITDSSKGQITVFEPTAYGQCLINGIIAYGHNEYEASKAYYAEAFRYNTNCELAYLGIGRSQLREGKYKDAMASFRLAASRVYYSRALEKYRAEVFDRNFGYLFGFVALLLVFLVFRPLGRRLWGQRLPEGNAPTPEMLPTRRADLLLKDIDFSFYCALHPFKGFHELRHEGQGSALGGSVILAMYTLLSIIRATLSGFLYGGSADHNPFMTAMTVLAPVVLFVVANWCITTLMEGEGRMRDIYKAVCYALMPIALGQVVLMVLSNVLTAEEAGIYNVINYGLGIYTVFLLLVGNMMAHGFTMSRTVGAALVTAIAMAVIVFIGYLFFNLLFEVAGFVKQIYQEIVFRV